MIGGLFVCEAGGEHVTLHFDDLTKEDMEETETSLYLPRAFSVK
jgi:hypothetical protein